MALVALLGLAFAVRHGDTPPMSIEPDSAARGDDITVRYAEPHEPSALTFEQDGRTYLLSSDHWRELGDDEDFWIFTTGERSVEQVVRIPYEAGRGRYRVCTMAREREDRVCDELTIR